MKELVIIAGPNGSGKSTLASQIEFNGEYISADKFEKNFLSHIIDKEERENRAIVIVAKEIQEQINHGKSFAFETVFATNRIPSFLETAKEKGYKIILHYIATESVEINIERVAKRVSEGGHNVPVKRIIERREKTLSMLPQLLQFTDEAILYDNSEEKLFAFLVKEDNQIKIIDSAPMWAKQILSLF